jgi:aminoglycoside phosphotransferase (APT) family kinase protein
MRPGSTLLRYESALHEFTKVRQRTFYPKTDLEVPVAELKARRERRDRDAEALAKELMQCLGFEGVRPISVQPLRAGTFHLLFRAEFAPDNVGFVRAGYTFQHRPSFEFVQEMSLTERLHNAGIPVSEVLFNDLTRVEFRLDYQLVREARGRPLNAIENPETQFIPDAILQDWGRTLARVHQIPATGAGLLNPRSLGEGRIEGVLSNWNEYLVLNLEQHLALCVTAGALSPEAAPAITDVIHRGILRLQRTPVSLLHGDPGHHNIFAEGDRISAIIDWEDALAGDPIFDIAFWGTFVRDYLREPFLRGYREITPLPEDFELRYWLYYLRISISKTAHRFLFGYTDKPGRPPAAERITKAFSHLTSLLK